MGFFQNRIERRTTFAKPVWSADSCRARVKKHLDGGGTFQQMRTIIADWMAKEPDDAYAHACATAFWQAWWDYLGETFDYNQLEDKSIFDDHTPEDIFA